MAFSTRSVSADGARPKLVARAARHGWYTVVATAGAAETLVDGHEGARAMSSAEGSKRSTSSYLDNESSRAREWALCRWTGRLPPEVVRVAYPPDAVHNYFSF